MSEPANLINIDIGGTFTDAYIVIDGVAAPASR